MTELDPKTERSMRRAARAVLDTPGLVERLADACLDAICAQVEAGAAEDIERARVTAAIRKTCEETAREGEDG